MTYKISVVLPIYNSEKTLSLCLESLKNQSLAPHEILAIDNNSNDQSSVLLKEFIKNNPSCPLRMLLEPKQCPSSARNLGLREAQYEIVAFLDSDCVAPENWLASLDAFFLSHPSVDAVGGILNSYQSNSLVDWYWHVERKSYRSVQNIWIDFPEQILFQNSFWVPCNSALRRKSFTDFYFDPKFSHAEDIDFTLRSLKAKKTVVANCTSISMFHQERKSIKNLALQIFHYRMGYCQMLRKHFSNQIINEWPIFPPISFPITVVLRKSSWMILMGLFFSIGVLCLKGLGTFFLFSGVLFVLKFFRDLFHYRSQIPTLRLSFWMQLALLRTVIQALSALSKIRGAIQHGIVYF